MDIVAAFRNPLSMIALDAWQLQDTLADHRDEDVRSSLADIMHRTALLGRLVSDLVDLDAIHLDRFELQRAPTALRPLIGDAIEHAVPSREWRRVTLDAPEPVTLVIDDHRIERVVASFLHHALERSPSTSGIIVCMEVNTSRVRVAVTDVAPEMTLDEMASVFDRYRTTPGTSALGGHKPAMFVSKRTVEAHGGRIGAEAMVGGGSRFYFDLPRAPAGAAPAMW